uniref:Necrosis inducing-like protein NPP1 type n=1 Tax=Phytophthora ramorum TaxID=164328 RepID=H3GUZ2_PHYRM
MNFCVFFVATLVSLVVLTAVQAQTNSIPHDQVQPFAQPNSITVSQKAAVKFKPQLKTLDGCYPYPAVQADGSTSGGLRWTVVGQRGDCTDPPLGSQIYARSTWYRDVWAIMYTWYFPKGSETSGGIGLGHRHNWEFVVVWIDNPALDNSTILGVSMSASIGYSKRAPPKSKYIDGTSVKVSYFYSIVFGNTALELTEDAGETQDLIMWDQLPDVARDALNTDWDTTLWNLGNAQMPLKDDVFTKKLKKSWPF